MSLRRTALTRRTELARTPLQRRTAIAVSSAMKRTISKQRKQRDTGPDEATKVLLWSRAGGRCELCGRDLTTGYPFSRHHRRPRGAGGSTVTWINDVTNLLLLCGTATSSGDCHPMVEANAQQMSYEAGWKVRMNSCYLPVEVPVVLHWAISLTPTFLTIEGEYAEGSP